MKMRNLFFLAVAISLLVGCVDYGPTYKEVRLDQLPLATRQLIKNQAGNDAVTEILASSYKGTLTGYNVVFTAATGDAREVRIPTDQYGVPK